MKTTRILFLCGAGFLLAVFFVGIYLVPKLQAGNSSTARQSDAGRVSLSDVYVDVTYATPQFVQRVKLEKYLERWKNRAQPFLIGVNTHVGTIAELDDLQSKILLEDSNGDRFPSLGAPIVLSEHHNMYLLVFPLVDNYGKPIFDPARKQFRLVVNGIGKTAERVFEWKLPVVEPATARTLANTLMLALGVIGSLMVILSPCAIELTSYYTGIIAGIVGSAAAADKTKRIPAMLRGRIVRNLGAFVLGFTVLYMASGATVAMLGQKLLEMQAALQRRAELEDPFCKIDGATNQPASQNIIAQGSVLSRSGPSNHQGHAHHGPGFGEWTRYANWLGAAFLIYFALRSIGWISGGGQCLVWLAKAGKQFRLAIAAVVGVFSQKRASIIRAPSLSLREAHNITPGNSFCAGLGLSVSCLTCMGGAILYPLLIFIGTSTWYWGAMILGTYSLALAIPMAAIALAVGNFTFQMAHRKWITRALQYSSALVMITVALLIVFDRTRFINHAVFNVLSALGGEAVAGKI
jgi:cytochrome c biogenesis protein CcdA